jgi:pyruvate-ferredoxin/flavodoxin oxidoreductase
LPKAFKEKIKKLNAKLYIIDAYKVATNAGLGNRINVIMQSCFFKITNIIPYEICEKQMKDSVVKLYSRKGDAVVTANMKAIDAATSDLYEIDINKLDLTINASPIDESHMSDFYKKFCHIIDQHNGDSLPVSAFMPDGSVPTGTTKYEKRATANTVPV